MSQFCQNIWQNKLIRMFLDDLCIHFSQNGESQCQPNANFLKAYRKSELCRCLAVIPSSIASPNSWKPKLRLCRLTCFPTKVPSALSSHTSWTALMCVHVCVCVEYFCIKPSLTSLTCQPPSVSHWTIIPIIPSVISHLSFPNPATHTHTRSHQHVHNWYLHNSS